MTLLTSAIVGSLSRMGVTPMRRSLLASNIAFLLATLPAQNQPSASRHDHELEHRGAQGMGFDQTTTTHHFLLQPNGGAIQVAANSADDKAAIEHIRMHLQHIRGAFQSGDFDIPGFVHDQIPPGVPVMIKFKDQIRYQYEQVPQGARVTISSRNADAVTAVHDFLRFQITEHKTGDPLEVK